MPLVVEASNGHSTGGNSLWSAMQSCWDEIQRLAGL